MILIDEADRLDLESLIVRQLQLHIDFQEV